MYQIIGNDEKMASMFVILKLDEFQIDIIFLHYSIPFIDCNKLEYTFGLQFLWQKVLCHTYIVIE